MKNVICVLLVAVFTVACATTNFPLNDRLSAISGEFRPHMVDLFFDANGNLYPEGWQTSVGDESDIRRHDSLLNAIYSSVCEAGSPCAPKQELERQEMETFTSLRRLTENAYQQLNGENRVFVFIHGFNNDEFEASLPYEYMVRQIVWQPGDILIRVYWDGGRNVASWFAAAGASQVVGMRGLRRVLANIRSRSVFLVSHSRGASVLLSSLSTPPFSGRFIRVTEGLPFCRR